jgi:hypothetical protein
MRAGPLSSPKVISLLNSCFVPVYVSDEVTAKGGSAPAEEKALAARIHREALERKLPAGSVHVYIVTPDGSPIDSLHVAEAARTERLVELLERAVKGLRLEAGKALIRPAAQSRPPAADPGSLIVHVTARGRKGASWNDFPSESWIVLGPREQAALLPAGDVAPGGSWEVGDGVAGEILCHFYPQTENNDAPASRILEQSLRATAVSAGEERIRARLDGRLRMRHDFYPGRDDGRVVDAVLAGYMDVDPRLRKVLVLRIVTERATYGPGTLDVAARSVDPAAGARARMGTRASRERVSDVEEVEALEVHVVRVERPQVVLAEDGGQVGVRHQVAARGHAGGDLAVDRPEALFLGEQAHVGQAEESLHVPHGFRRRKRRLEDRRVRGRAKVAHQRRPREAADSVPEGHRSSVDLGLHPPRGPLEPRRRKGFLLTPPAQFPREEVGDEPPQGLSLLLLEALQVAKDRGIDVHGRPRHSSVTVRARAIIS